MKPIIMLLKQQKYSEIIEGVLSLEGDKVILDFNNVSKWAIKLKIIVTKKKTRVKTILEVHTSATACALYQTEKDYCEQNNIRTGSKNTNIEYTKKIGF